LIDVSGKGITLRYARAEGWLEGSAEVIDRVRQGTVPKGDVRATARAAGIAAAKRCSDWIVFCHPIPLDWVDLTVEVEGERLHVVSEVRSNWRTGVEMEAVTAVSGALLNAYDMLKPIDKDMTMSGIRVLEKRGGKSDGAPA